MLSFLFRGARTSGLPTPLTPPDSARCGARFHYHWGAIPFPVGHDSGKWGTIPLPSEKCPTSQRNPAPHRSGTLPHFKRNQCPTSTGIRNSELATIDDEQRVIS